MRAFWLELNKGSPMSPAPYRLRRRHRGDGPADPHPELRTTGLSYMPEGLEKQIDVPAMADLLAYLTFDQVRAVGAGGGPASSPEVTFHGVSS